MSIVSVRNDTLGKVSVINAFAPLAPVITGYNILVSGVIVDDTAVDTAGGQTIQVNGTGFISGAVITLGGSGVTTAYVNANTLTFTAPIKTAATYAIYVLNPDGGTAIFIPGVVYSGTPAWTTTAISPATVYETNSITTTALVTTGGDGSIVYSLASGTLPVGATLDAGTGQISGTAPAVGSNTTYTFTIKATDQQLQDSTSTSFSLTINTDVVTWSSPAAASTITLAQNAASTTALVASSAAGKAITYTSTALPAGLSISGATVTGTPTAVATTAVTFTATAATSGRTTTAVINWTISVAADTYFRNTTLLLSGAAATETFITDASVNNFPLTIVGDTKPSNFNPYTPGYYSNYFAANEQLTSTTIGTSIGTSDFSMECWVYVPVAANSYAAAIQLNVSTGYNLYIQTHSSTLRVLDYNNPAGSNFQLTGGTINSNTWHHLLLTRQSGTVRGFIDGKLTVNQTAVTFNYGTAGTCQINAGLLAANISNARVILGNVPAAYQTSSTTNGTQIFTPSTLPLTAVSGTALLTCQSNRFVDNSANLFTLTKAGSPQIQSFTPFVPNSTYATQGSTYFDGNADYLSIPSNSALQLPTGDFTIEAWIYLTGALGSYYFIFTQIGATNATSNWDFIVNGNASGQLRFEAFSGGTQIINLTGTSSVPVNAWTHVAVTRSGSTYTIWMNGFSQGTASSASTVNSNAITTYIGENHNNTYYFPGYITDVRIVKGTAVYTTTFTPPTAPLTATQLANTNGNPSVAITGSQTSLLTLQTNQPASNSVFLDSSTNAFAVTRAGNTSAGTFTPYGANWSNYFNGSSYMVPATGINAAMGTGFAGNIISFEMWIFPTDFNSSSYNQGLASAYAAVSSSSRWGIVLTKTAASTTSFTFLNTDSASSEVYATTTTSPITLNQWHHIVVTIDATTAASSTIKLFANGVLLNTFTGRNLSMQTAYYRAVVIGGANSQYMSEFFGYISNFRILKGAFAYTGNYTVPTAPLTAIANTVLLTCQSNSFVDNSANAFALSLTGPPTVQRFSPFSPQTQTAITHSAYFDGNGDYLSVPSNAAFQLGTGDFTIEFWWNGSASGTFTQNIGTLVNSTETGTYRIGTRFNGTNYVYFARGTGASFEEVTYNVNVNDGAWNHIAFVRTSGVVALYVNGTARTAATGSTAISGTCTTSNPLVLGYNGRDVVYSTGYTSNVRVVKGVAVYTGTFTPPATPLTATQSAGTNIAAITGTQTSLLTCQSPTFVDNSTNAFAITAFGEAKPRTLNPFGFTNASAAYSAATYGGSAYFDGTTDYLSVPNNASLAINGDATIEFWLYLPSMPATYSAIWALNQTPLYMIYVTAAGNVGIQTSGGYRDTTTGPISAKAWFHIAVTKTGGNVYTVYVNGIVQASSGTGTMLGSIPANATFIGMAYGSANLVTGYVSNARIVSGTAVYTSNFVPPSAPLTAITNTSLLLNMTSAGIYDSASMSNLETVADAKRVATHTPYAGSFYSNYFDGTTDQLTTVATGLVPATNPFTIECWVYSTSYGDRGIVAQSAGGAGRLIVAINSSGNVNFQIGGTTLTTTGYAIGLNQWTHIAITRVVSTVTIYFNGVSVATGGNATAVDNVIVTIGRVPTYSQYWIGYISNLRIVNGVAVYTGNFAVPTAPLTAIQASGGTNIVAITGSATSLLTCQSNRFVDNSANAFAITRAGSTSVQSFNPFQRNSAATLSFDGTGDYLKAPYNPGFFFGTGDFTIECWLYQIAFTSDMVIVASLTTWPSQVNFYFGTRAGSPNILIFRAGDGIPITLNGNTGLTTNTWTHVAASRAAGVTRIFVNGVTQSATHTGSVNIGITLESTGIGAANNATEPINGYINDLRITKGVARYTTTFVPPTTAFIAK